MKNILKVLCLTLSLLMVAAVFIACGDTPSNKEEDKKPGEQTGEKDDPSGKDDPEKEWKLELPDVDYDGQDFKILCRTQVNGISDLYIDPQAANQSIVDKSILDRQAYVKSTYGIDLKYKNVGSEGEVDSIVNTQALAGIEYDLVANHGRNVFPMVLNGYCHDWNELEYVQIEAPWWSQSAREELVSPSGANYVMVGDISHMYVGECDAMFFNEQLLEDANMSLPYDIVRNNEWTFENFLGYCKMAAASLETDGTGDINTDSFAYITNHWRGPVQIIYASGTGYTKNYGDEVEITVYDDRTADALEQFIDLVCKKDYGYVRTTDGYNDLHAAFISDRAVFYDDIVHVAYSNWVKSEVKFGVLPFPKLDEDVENYCTFTNANTNFFFVPYGKEDEDYEFISVALEAMAYYGYKNIIPMYYEQVLSYQTMPNPDSLEMLKIIRNSATFDLGYDAGYVSDLGVDMANSLGTISAVSLYQQKYEKWDTKIEKWLDMDY